MLIFHAHKSNLTKRLMNNFISHFYFIVGLGIFIYHEKFLNKPQTLDDRYSSSESEGGISNENSSRRISHIDCSVFDAAPRVNYHFILTGYVISRQMVKKCCFVFALGRIQNVSYET